MGHEGTGEGPKEVPFRVVIPSRFGASRLPGKPLRLLASRSLVARVWDVGQASGASSVCVATDDERIVAEVESIGGRAIMTSASHQSGTDRLAELARLEGYGEDEIVVNLQGDEPCLPSELLRKVAMSLASRPDCGIATLATPIHSSEELFSPNAVKAVFADDGRALYFSRAPIPWSRKDFAEVFKPSQDLPVLPVGANYFRHIGIYAYRVKELLQIAEAAPHPLEESESLEQLRALGLGIGIHVGVCLDPPPPGVDTEEDLQRAARSFQE